MAGSDTDTSAHRTLPQEIFNMIIDFLHDDRPTLKYCAQVCKPWVPASHQHLFRDFRIEATPSFKAGYSAQLKAVLQQSFYVYICRLTVVALPTRSLLYPELFEEDVVAFFTLLPRLRSLKLDRTGFTGPISCSRPNSRFCADKITVNWIYSSIPGSGSSTGDLLSLFHEIRELDLKVIHHRYLPDAITTEEIEPSPTIKVDILTLSDVSRPLLRLLRRMISSCRLHTVRVSVADAADVVELGVFLGTVGSNLLEFQLSIWNFWSNDFTDWNTLGLSNCPNLQSVVILYANSGAFYSWETVCDILAAVPAVVQEVTIVVRDEHCLYSANWPRLYQRLEHVTNLQHVHVRLCRGGDLFQSREVPQKAMDRLHRALPLLKSRGPPH